MSDESVGANHPNWVDYLYLVSIALLPGIAWYFGVSRLGTAAVSMIGLVAYLALTTVSGLYPWSMRP